MRGRRVHSAGGFTLVEVLATLAFAAVLLPAVVNGISQSLAVASVAKRRAQAAALAHAKLSELVAAGQLQEASMTGDFGTDWPGYRWSAKVSNFEGDTLKQLDVTVVWGGGRLQRDVTVSTLFYTGGTQ